MKKLITALTLAGLTIAFGSGCVTQQKQVLEKSTVFGFQAKTPGGTGYSTTLQIGLVRNEYFSQPTSTNPIYAPQFSSHVNAKLSAMSQTAIEDFSTLQQEVVTSTNQDTSITTK